MLGTLRGLAWPGRSHALRVRDHGTPPPAPPRHGAGQLHRMSRSVGPFVSSFGVWTDQSNAKAEGLEPFRELVRVTEHRVVVAGHVLCLDAEACRRLAVEEVDGEEAVAAGPGGPGCGRLATAIVRAGITDRCPSDSSGAYLSSM